LALVYNGIRGRAKLCASRFGEQEWRSTVAGRRAFDRSRFKDLVLLLSRESIEAGDEGFGIVKLNKLLYRSDFEAFRLLGQSITGAAYERQDYGPVARELPLALDELVQGGFLAWQHVPAGPYTRDVPEPQVAPDQSLFTEEELAIVYAALKELSPLGGKSVSEWSHEESAGWRVRKTGDEITYESGLIDVTPLDPERHAALRAYGLTLPE
jgi:Protein of unknown function (DUF4065)